MKNFDLSRVSVGSNVDSDYYKKQQETQEQSQAKAVLSATYVDNGRLRTDKNKIAQSKGFLNAMDEATYKTEHPELYAATNGVKYIKPGTDMSGAPFTATAAHDYDYALNLSNAAVNKIQNRFNNTDTKEIDGIIETLNSGEWQDADTMKKYSDTVNTYANDYIALEELGYFDSVPEADRKANVESLKNLKEFVNSGKDTFAKFSNADDFNKATWINKYSSMTWEELEAAEQKIYDEQELRYVKNILANQDKNVWNRVVSFKKSSTEEQDDVLSEVTYGVDRYEEAKGYIDIIKKSAKKPEDTDGYIAFVKDWYNKNGTTDGAREAYGISKGYIDNRSQYSKKEENNPQMLDYADTIAFYETKYGSKENLDNLAEQLTEYHENENTNEEFAKYYTKMQSDPNADKYIKKGKKIYETKNKNITDEEYDVVCYYLGKGEKDNYYLTWLKDVVYKREVAAASGWSAITDGTTLKYHRLWSDYTKSAPLEANAMSVALNLGAGAEFVYNTLNGDVKESKLSKASSKIREAYSNTHDGEFLGIDHDMWYNTAMSALDSLASAAMFGKVDKAGRVAAGVLALSAAASGINDALDRGMTGTQALLNGLANGVNEYIWEKYSLGELDKLATSNGAGFKTFITNLLKTVFVNASEETATETANILYDTVFNGDLSHYQLSIQRYLQNGLTENEAKSQALKDLGKQIKEAAESGALMGFGFGVIGTSSATRNASNYGKYYYGFSQKSINALVQNGLTMPESSAAYKQAVKAQLKIDSGKNVSGTTLYNLATAIESEIEKKSTARLNALGESKSEIKSLSSIVAKKVFNGRLTSDEFDALNNSKFGNQVVEELSADRANTVWKNAIKNSQVSNTSAEYSAGLQSTAESVADSGSDDIVQHSGQGAASAEIGSVPNNPDRAAPDVVEGSDGRKYFADGSGDEYNIPYSSEGEIISSFGIKKMNDTIHVQECVFDKLLEEGFFENINERNTIVTNKDSGMVIEINKSGIRETFNFHNFTQMPHEVMVDKLAVIRHLPEIIENGRLYDNNVKNIHNKKTSISYAYITQKVNINGAIKTATVAIRKSPQKNKFWVLQIDIKNNIESTPAGISKNSKTGLLTSNVKLNLSQNYQSVNTEKNNYDGRGDEYFGDAYESAGGSEQLGGVPALVSASSAASGNNAFELTEPVQKDIARAPSNAEVIEQVISGKTLNNVQRHIVDIAGKMDSGVKIEFVKGLKQNGRYIRSQNLLRINADLSTAQMYVQIFKHEFMHHLETKQLYGSFSKYCFNKSKAFEQYARASLKMIDNTDNKYYNSSVDNISRDGVVNTLADYYYDQYKNDTSIGKAERDAFTHENARQEMVADFFAEVLFQGESYRRRIAAALATEGMLPEGDIQSSEAALLKMKQKEPNLFKRLVEWLKGLRQKLRELNGAKHLVDDVEKTIAYLENDIVYLEQKAARVYLSKDSNRLVWDKNGEVKYSLIGRTADGTGIYKTNYPPNTPKSIKQADLISLVQNIWCKNPITLDIVEGGVLRKITARFNPELSERSDLAKIAFGNKKGNASEQRTTLDLASDLYQIAADSRYLYSKDAMPKPQNPAHDGVSKYHYFLTNIVYKDSKDNYINCHLNIDIKQNTKGNWFYSFGIEKGSAPQTLLAAVTENSATLPINSISKSVEKVNTEKSNDTPLGQSSIGSPMQNVKYGDRFELSSPDIEGIEISEETEFLNSLNNRNLNKTQMHIQDISNHLDTNLTVEFVKGLKQNGRYIHSQNLLRINADLSTAQMYMQIFKHEFMHHLETKQLYGSFSKYCFNKSKAFEQYARASLKLIDNTDNKYYNSSVDNISRDGVVNTLAEYYYDQYKNDTSIGKAERDAFTHENARQEMVADFFAEVLFQGESYKKRIAAALATEGMLPEGDVQSSEAALLEMKQKEPNLFKRLIEWLKGLTQKLRELNGAKHLVDDIEKTIAYLENDIARLEQKAARVYLSKDSKKALQNTQRDKYSVGGVKSKTHSHSSLEQAIRLYDIGKMSSEEIRQQTGWYRGYDGKWRYEIDDSKMELIVDDKMVKQFKYLMLDEVIEHNELFDAYPELRYTMVVFKDLSSFNNGETGIYISSQGTIFVRNNLKNDELKDTLIHEIQHNIQHIEGFASGSSPSYWQRQLDNGFDSRTQEAKNDYNEILAQYKTVKENDSEFFKDVTSLMETVPTVPRGEFDFETFEKIEDDPIEWQEFDKNRNALEAKYGDVKVFRFMDVISKVNNDKSKGTRSATDLYWYTAGEVEARDVANRRNLTAEQRKNTRPDIDRTDVVFADSSEASWQSSKDAKYDSEISSISQQIKNSQAILNKMDVVGEATVPEKIKSKYDAAQWAISQLKSFGYQVDRQNFGKIYFDEKDIRHGAEYADTYAEKGAFVLIPKVLKRGVEIGRHGNHKLRQKATVTFAAPVMLNGLRGNMAVVVNLNGNRYLVHRIILPDGTVFNFSKKNKEVKQESYQGVTENSSLADTTSFTSKDSILDSAEKVNTENSDDSVTGQSSIGSPMQQMRYNPEAYAKHLNRKYGSKADSDLIAEKFKQIVTQDNKSAKAQEDTRQKVYDREGNLIGELTLKERLINEVAVEIAENVVPPRDEYADEVISYIEEDRLYVDRKQRLKIRKAYGSLTNYYKTVGIRLSDPQNPEFDEDWVSLTDAWEDWTEAYSELFSSRISTEDMPARLAEIMEYLNSLTEELDYNSIATDIAEDIYTSLDETNSNAENKQANEAYRKIFAELYRENMELGSDEEAAEYADGSNNVVDEAKIDIDNNSVENYNYDTYYGEQLYNTPQYLKPSTDREWHAFCRSFANKTSGISSNKIITIFTADNYYKVRADGYMSGTILQKVEIKDYEKGQENYDSLGWTETAYSQDEILGNRQNDYGYSSDVVANEKRDISHDEVDGFLNEHPELFTNRRKSYADYRRESDAGLKYTPESAQQVLEENYTKTQYNCFGWAIYNGVITPGEREILFSRYADYKHNKSGYPTTKFGEAVIHSDKCPDILMYVKGDVNTPYITKIVRINTNEYNAETIKGEILHYEQRQILLSYDHVESVYGEGVLNIYTKRNFVPFQEYSSERERRIRERNSYYNNTEQDGTGSIGENTAADRADSVEESAFSIEADDTLGSSSYCFIKSRDTAKIEAAENMESEGKDSLYIWRNLRIFRGISGDWLKTVNADGLRFYPDGTAKTEAHTRNTRLKKYNGNIEGKLSDFLHWKQLYNIYPHFKDTKVVLTDSSYSYDTVRYIPERNALIIDKKLCDNYKESGNRDVKAYLMREIQRMIQIEEGRYIGKNRDYWKNAEREGKLPFSKYLNRYLTADDMMKYFIDNYEAEMVAKRQIVGDLAHQNAKQKITDLDDLLLYMPYVEPDKAFMFDSDGNLVTVRENDERTGENKFKNYPKSNNLINADYKADAVDNDHNLNYNENNINGGEEYDIFNRRGTYGDNSQSENINSGTEAGMAGVYEETTLAFKRRVRETYKGSRRTVSHLNITVAYKEANKVEINSPADIAYNILKSKGYNVIYCDGTFLINNGKQTFERSEAVTISDGTVYISNNATLDGTGIALHEVVHVWQYMHKKEYTQYYNTLCEEINLICEEYADLAHQINNNHFGGKYDIDDINSFEYIMRELTAYINQYVCIDPEYAKYKFGGIFKVWDNVVQAVYRMNSQLQFGDIINKATSDNEVAVFIHENSSSYRINEDEFIHGLRGEETDPEFTQEYLNKLLDSFGITKLGDYIHVQKCVFNTLEKEGFFTDRENRCTKVVNSASGMVVEINKKGIKETFDLENYIHIGRNKKIAKLVTIRHLEEIIRYGELQEDDVRNTHKGTAKNKSFAYIRHTLNIDGKAITVQIDIKKSPEKNKFWVHKIIKLDGTNNIPNNVKAIKSGYNKVSAKNANANTQPDNVKAIKSGKTKVSAKNANANNLPDNVKAIKSGHNKVSADEQSISQGENKVNTLSDKDWSEYSSNVDNEDVLNYNENNINGGEENVIYKRRGLGPSDEGTDRTVNSGTEAGMAGVYEETTLAFKRRVEGIYGNSGRAVSHLNITVAYKKADKINKNSPAGIAYNVLNSKGYNVVYCDGVFLINNGKQTFERNEAVTIFDGTVYISSNATLNGTGIALHEVVHVWQYNSIDEYANYESVLCEELDHMGEEYIKVAKEINNNHFGGKYNMEAIDSFKPILRELAAYINQYVCIDPEYAKYKFGGMFENWDNVVQAVYRMNSQLQFGDIIINRGEINAENYQGTVGSFGGETDGRNTGGTRGKTKENEEIAREDKSAFKRRVAGTYKNTRRLFVHLNVTIACKKSSKVDKNLPAGVAYNILKSKGYNVVYCDGSILINNNKVTVERTEAVTLYDGTVYISNNATLDGTGIALHEVVHVWQYADIEEYLGYKDVLCDNIIFTSEKYKEIAKEINDNHYNSKYDIDDINSFEYIMRELAAYINQYVCIDPEYAKQKFGGMFENWDNVVQAVYRMNSQLQFGDIIINRGEINAENYQGTVGQNEDRTYGSYFGKEREDGTSGETNDGYDTGGTPKITESNLGRADFHGGKDPVIGEIGQENREKKVVSYSKRNVIYFEANPDDSDGYKAYKAFCDSGIKSVYCDGNIIVSGMDGEIVCSEAITAPDGMVFVSNNSTLPAKQIYDHEKVHVADFTNMNFYLDYEEVLCDNIDYLSQTYKEVTQKINNGQFDGKYDVDDIIGTAKVFISEISAYVNQYVLSDINYAKHLFSGMFNSWETVVNAVYKFNEYMQATSQGEAAFILSDNIVENGETTAKVKNFVASNKKTRAEQQKIRNNGNIKGGNSGFAESIKKDRVVSMGVPNNRSHIRTSPVTVSIPDSATKINSKDTDFLNTEETAKNKNGIANVKSSYKIIENMTDLQRYKILKNRTLTLAQAKDAEINKVMSENPLLLDKKLKTKEAEKILKKIGEEFGVFTEYRNNDVEIEFEFGRNNLSESVNKQKGNYDKYAQMLSCFSDVISNAVGIEAHNRNIEGYKPDITLKNVYVLCSAFENSADVVPVKLEIKEFYDKPNRLYVAVSLKSIKKDRVAGMGVPNNRSHIRTSPVTISIHDLFSKINPKDTDFLKYIPNGFLNAEQIAAKNQKIPVSSQDTVGRKLDTSVQSRLSDSVAKNEKGEPISLYAINRYGANMLRHEQFGIVLGTVDAAIQKYEAQNADSNYVVTGVCEEYYAIIKKPLYMPFEPYELSVGEIGFWLTEEGILSREEYFDIVDSISATKKPRYYNAATKRLRNKLKNLGYDCIMYKNQKYDAGSLALVVFDNTQLIPVAKDGVLIDGNGISDGRYTAAQNQTANAKANTEMMRYFAEDAAYTRRKDRKKADHRIMAGNSGWFEQSDTDAEREFDKIRQEIAGKSQVEYNPYANPARAFARSTVKELENTVFKTNDGEFISFYLHAKDAPDIDGIVKYGIEFKGFNSAFMQFAEQKQASGYSYNGVFCEYILNSVNPLVVRLNGWNTSDMALSLLKSKKISQMYYNELMSLDTADSDTYTNYAAKKLRDKIDMLGYDSIIFVKDSGEKSVIVFDSKQILPVSQNGILDSDNGITQKEDVDKALVSDEYKAQSVVIDKKGRPERNINDIKDKILSELDNTKKLKMLTEFLECTNNHVSENTDNINVGYSGQLEKKEANIWQAQARLSELAANKIPISNIDTADRAVAQKIQSEYKDTILKDNDGRLLSLFIWNKYGKNRHKHSAFAYNAGTLAFAHDNYLIEKQKHPALKKGVYEEYYGNITNAYFMAHVPQEFSAMEIATDMYQNGILNKSEYRDIISREGAEWSHRDNNAARHLRKALREKGFDSIAYMSKAADHGSIGIIPLDETQLTLVSENGVAVDTDKSVENIGGSGYNENIIDGLTQSEKAEIKKKTGWSDDIVDYIHSMSEAQIYINANLIESEINGKKCLIRSDIDMDFISSDGITNRDRMKRGEAPYALNGEKIQLHHIGQKQDSPLAELTKSEHLGKGNFKFLHDVKKVSEINRTSFDPERQKYWKFRFN